MISLSFIPNEKLKCNTKFDLEVGPKGISAQIPLAINCNDSCLCTVAHTQHLSLIMAALQKAIAMETTIFASGGVV